LSGFVRQTWRLRTPRAVQPVPAAGGPRAVFPPDRRPVHGAQAALATRCADAPDLLDATGAPGGARGGCWGHRVGARLPPRGGAHRDRVAAMASAAAGGCPYCSPAGSRPPTTSSWWTRPPARQRPRPWW